MLMYGVSERLILCRWSLETLVKKVRHGFDFELIKHGVKPKGESTEGAGLEKLSDAEIVRLYGDE